MEALEAVGRKLELGIFRTSKPIKESKESKESSPTKPKSRSTSHSPSKSVDGLTQRLFVKRKKEKECFADATVFKSNMVCRESAQKTINLPFSAKNKPLVKESAQLTVKLPPAKTTTTTTTRQSKKAQPEVAPEVVKSAPEVVKSSPEKVKSEPEESSQSACVHLVEKRLTEIALQAEELAQKLRKQAEFDEVASTSELSEETTQLDVDSNTLDSQYSEPEDDNGEDNQHVLQVEIAAPVVKASEELCLSSPRSPRKTLLSRDAATTPDSVTDIDNFVDLKKLAEATRSLLQFSQSENQMPTMSSSEINLDSHNARESLADRLTKGFHDLTHGSTDRLQRWKTKLNTSGRRGAKDQSEPPPINRSQMTSATVPATDVLLDWSSARNPPRPLHCSKSASNALKDQNSPQSNGMEHRTLKSKENTTSHKDLAFHYQNMNSLQKLMNTMDSFTKTAQFNLPPPAKITPHSGVKPTHDDILRPVAFRAVTNQQTSDDRQRQSHDFRHFERQVIRGDLTKSASNLYHPNNVQSGVRHRPFFPPSTSFSSKMQENEYDTVPEYIEKEKFSDFGSSGSDYGSFNPPKLTSSTVSSGTGSSHLSSPSGTHKKPSLGATGRSASGVHVTPSPSDSGIVDYEAIMRDRENELREIRNTMEQNEEIIVKVYQEKEKVWKEELEQLRQRLAASERGENGLRAQLAGCQRQTDALQRTVEGLREEKTGLLRKCFQVERELTSVKQELDKPRLCDVCKQHEKPIPAPRQIKDQEPSIRSEVSSLREEVSMLKEALHGQIQVFADERKKWEQRQNPPEPVDRLI